MSDNTQSGGMKAFATIWIGQLVSLLGSGLTSFALGIWVLERTQSVTQYTLIILCASLPGVLIAPFAGALVDRWDRKWVMFFTDLGPGLITLTYAFLLWKGELHVWHIYIGAALNAMFSSFQWPAYISSITMLVDRSQYGRVNGMLDFGQAGSTIAAPALAGLLLSVVNVWGVLLVDFATFLFAAATLLMVHIPRPETSAGASKAKGSLWKEAGYGWTFIRERPGLLGLLLFFAVLNLALCTCGVAIVPMVLAFTGSKAIVGTISSLVGVGMLVGGAIMTATGGPKPRVYGVLSMGLVISICFVLVGARPSLVLVGAGVLLWYIAIPIMNGSSTAIWQSKTPGDVQGRVFAMRRMIAQFTTPIGDFSAGPLADKVFIPLLLPGGALADTAIGRLVGVGPGRGIGLMFLTFAAVPGLAALWGFLNPRVRNVEAELPDAPKRQAAPPPKAEEKKDEEAQPTAAPA
ncbi:MAG TPA: MFS transporter [Thermoanaerobaculia bacterium]|jgi:MFS family permease|nr:MFS transporter [Thermoanaerobaculia bacterium]